MFIVFIIFTKLPIIGKITKLFHKTVISDNQTKPLSLYSQNQTTKI